ncbi:MAG: hypothetical protein EXR72_00415 [Myxococcales bacterium]|nr:hypothetical protein [Myxococcales bacterium]
MIPDEDGPGTTALIQALQAGGLTVSNAGVPSFQYQGNPAPANFDVVLLLAGGPGPSSANINMPQAGQDAIANFVQNKGGLINTEWSAFQVAAGRWQTLKPLVLLQRTSGTTGFVDYSVTPAFAAHPLWVGLPQTFQFATATNVGVVIPNPGVVRVATSKLAGDAVALRDAVNVGRIVQLSSSGNYSPGTWTDANIKKLMINSCKWASAARVNNMPKALPGGPYTVDTGSTVTLNGSCNDPDGDPTTILWDFNNAGAFLDAMGQNPMFSAKNISGPAMVTIQMKCTDTGGLFEIKTTTVNVANVGPKFSSLPPLVATEGVQYTYPPVIVDPDPKDVFTCKLDLGPMGMTVNQNNCTVAWLPGYDQARFGTAKVAITVADKAGATDTQAWTLQVVLIDTDMDGLPDTWEKMYFGDLKQVSGGDPDKDGRPNLKEYQDATDPMKYDGPSAPTPISPDKDMKVGKGPDLKVMNAISPKGDSLTYEFAIYTDAQLTTLIDLTLGVQEGGNGTTSSTVKVMLSENKHLFWRCRARDPYISGNWSAVAKMFVDAIHDPPTAPQISLPTDNSKVKVTHPSLEVTNARSPDELPLTYEFELYSDMNLTQKVAAKAGINEDMSGTTAWFVAVDLVPYASYWWRARATDDQMLSGPWSQIARFTVFPTNPSPSAPVIEYPKNGARISTRIPEFKFGGSSDLDGEKLSYQCDVDISNTFDSAQKQSVMGLVPDAQSKSMWSPMTLAENQGYCLRCRARDPSGSSSWAQSCFLIDVKNDPPSVPTLSNPSMGGMAAGPVAVFTWVDSIDPEGDPIHYDVEVYLDPGLTAQSGMGSGGAGTVGVTITGLGSGGYFWRARAVDSLMAASEWSEANAFAVSTYDLPPGLLGNGAGCGCHVGARGNSPSLTLAVLALLALAALRRRRPR